MQEFAKDPTNDPKPGACRTEETGLDRWLSALQQQAHDPTPSTADSQIDLLQAEIEESVAAETAMATDSWSSALQTAINVAGFQEGDEVIVPALAPASLANAVIRCNATPIFADIDPRTFLLDPQDVVRKISSSTVGLISFDHAGRPVDYPTLQLIARKNQLAFIGTGPELSKATSWNRHVAQWTDLACFPIFDRDNQDLFEVGVVLGDQAKRTAALKPFCDHEVSEQPSAGVEDSEPLASILDFRPREMACRMARIQLADNHAKHETTNQLVESLCSHLQTNRFIQLPAIDPGSAAIFCHLPVRWRQTDSGISRDQVVQHLRSKGLEASSDYRPFYQHSFYRQSCQNSRQVSCPNADQLGPELIALPLFPNMTEWDVQRMVKEFRQLEMQGVRQHEVTEKRVA